MHEVLEDGLLRELHAATGGAWGGILVNEAFQKFIQNLVFVLIRYGILN